MPGIAVQLYTLRNEMEQQFYEVLQQVKDLGYEGVEWAGFHGHPVEEVAAFFDQLGLKSAGMHVSLDRLQTAFPEVLKEAELLHVSRVIVPYLEQKWQTPEGYKAVRVQLEEAAAKLAAEGINLSYHHHDFELAVEVDGQSALEYLFAGDPLLGAEFDLFWLKKGGRDPLAFIQAYPGRASLLHVKDMTDDEAQTFTEVGNGTIDFVPIIEWAAANGTEWLIVEQDVCPGNAIDSVAISIKNLRPLVK